MTTTPEYRLHWQQWEDATTDHAGANVFLEQREDDTWTEIDSDGFLYCAPGEEPSDGCYRYDEPTGFDIYRAKMLTKHNLPEDTLEEFDHPLC